MGINIYKQALLVQSACNLSGVVHSLAEIVGVIREEAHQKGLGTDYVNTHPVVRLFAEQILHLSGGGCGDSESYFRAYKECERLGYADEIKTETV